MGMASILFNGAEPFKQIVHTLSTESPMWNLVKIVQAVQKGRSTFKTKMAAVVAILVVRSYFDLQVILLLQCKF